MPFKHIYLNYLQLLTSACLLIINACNVLPSFSVVFDVMVVSAMGDILTKLLYLEVVLLVIVPLSLPVWKLWEVIKEKQAKKDSPAAWCITWLGFELNTKNHTLGIPEAKKQALLHKFYTEFMTDGAW